jgi:hypothetical protein
MFRIGYSVLSSGHLPVMRLRGRYTQQTVPNPGKSKNIHVPTVLVFNVLRTAETNRQRPEHVWLPLARVLGCAP